jgi:HPt (histidine-containing phosphotransfer) domain-containing protein
MIENYVPPSDAQPDDSFAPVSIPPGIEEAAKRYLQSRKNDLPRLMELAAAKEFEQLRILSHNMKGTGTSYGFPDLTRLGRLMEASAKEQNAGDMSAQLLELSRYLKQASEALAAADSPATS